MLVLHVIGTVDPRGGGPMEGVKQRTKYMAERGVTVEVLSGDDPNADFVRDYPGKLYALGPTKTLEYSPRLAPWLRENLDRYDAVFVSGLWRHNGLAVSAACKKHRKKYWVFTHGMLDPWFNKTYPLKRLKKMAFWPWQYVALRDAEAVLFTSEEERLLARQSFRPYKVRERVVSYGAGRPPTDDGSQMSRFLERFPQLEGKPFILYLSRIHPKKGCDLLLEAFARVSEKATDLHLVMAGPVAAEYRGVLDGIQLPADAARRVVWTDMLSGAEKYGAFRAAEAFILPSHQENFGISVAEALACAKPVLISRRINIWREIEADGAGFVEEDTLDGTVSLLSRWLKCMPSERAAMSERALACYEHRFTIEKAADDLVALLHGGS